MRMNDRVTVVGGGLAGCEAAWQLLKRGIPVRLVEMKPETYSPAHTMEGLAELVCSNSLKAEHLTNASGLLKAEMKKLDSLILDCAERARVPAGGALAVDRERFSREVTQRLTEHPLMRLERARLDEVPEGPAIIATGPLTHETLARAISGLPGMNTLYFFDAAAPIVTKDSLDDTKVFRASRYGRGDGEDYLNCPMTEAEYNAFYDALMGAELAEVHEFDKAHVFEGCLAVEILAARGRQTLAFGPLKPVGLKDPRTGREPYAVVQLRQDNEAGTLYNLVGFQTRLKWGEQKRVFSMIPGLERAEFVRYGVMHRNTYLHAPGVLNERFQMIHRPELYFAGQMTGVEGYMESAASGLMAGLHMARQLRGQAPARFSPQTVMGALARHVSTPTRDYQPMNANFGILDALDERVRSKKQRYERLAARALDKMDETIKEYRLLEEWTDDH